jgi:methylenetetrahydrofolate--tRNA-(uracil-5-)-methyltransferase
MTLAFGPMKPVGLEDPRTGRRPFAVVQLRQEDEAKTSYNMVGFQTRMTWPEQKRVFQMIPGLENAEYHRMGSVHRNTFVNAPVCLDERMQLRAKKGVHLAGQITGVEGYVESCAGGLLCALMMAGVTAPPKTTALGGLLGHLRREVPDYQPSNITWAHVAPLPMRAKKRERYEAMAERALRDLAAWQAGTVADPAHFEKTDHVLL